MKLVKALAKLLTIGKLRSNVRLIGNSSGKEGSKKKRIYPRRKFTENDGQEKILIKST